MVTLPNPYCSVNLEGHYYLQLVGSNIWRCKHCWASKWLPYTWMEYCDFLMEVRKYGVDKAYELRVARMPRVKELLEKLEEMRLLRRVLPEEDLVKVVAAIFREKED